MIIKETTKISTRIIASVFDMRSAYAMELEQRIQSFIKQPVRDRSIYKEMVGELTRLFKVREYVNSNIIVDAGRAVIAQRLANDTTYTGIINYGTLGSSSTTPTNSDTQLGTEVFRKVTASDSTSNNIAFIDFFYSKSDTNGTYEEFGTVIDGTASANTGQLFTHALTGSWVKTALESMTVAVQYTIS